MNCQKWICTITLIRMSSRHLCFQIQVRSQRQRFFICNIQPLHYLLLDRGQHEEGAFRINSGLFSEILLNLIHLKTTLLMDDKNSTFFYFQRWEIPLKVNIYFFFRSTIFHQTEACEGFGRLFLLSLAAATLIFHFDQKYDKIEICSFTW